MHGTLTTLNHQKIDQEDIFRIRIAYSESNKIIWKTRRCTSCKKNINDSLTDLVTTWNQEMLAHLKKKVDVFHLVGKGRCVVAAAISHKVHQAELVRPLYCSTTLIYGSNRQEGYAAIFFGREDNRRQPPSHCWCRSQDCDHQSSLDEDWCKNFTLLWSALSRCCSWEPS